MVVVTWLLLVVDCGESIESTGDLENGVHLVLEECLTTAVVVEAEVGNIIKVLVDLALVVEHEVKIEDQAVEVDELRP